MKKWTHDFWDSNDESDEICGKMFGVLVVKNKQGDLGYLAAFSGKLAEENYLKVSLVQYMTDLKKKDFLKRKRH